MNLSHKKTTTAKFNKEGYTRLCQILPIIIVVLFGAFLPAHNAIAHAGNPKETKWEKPQRLPYLLYPGRYDQGYARIISIREGKLGLIDSNGNVVAKTIYDWMGPYNRLARVQLNGKWGYINNTGKVVVPIKYDESSDFDLGFAFVRIGKRTIVLDTSGRKLYETDRPIQRVQLTRTNPDGWDEKSPNIFDFVDDFTDDNRQTYKTIIGTYGDTIVATTTYDLFLTRDFYYELIRDAVYPNGHIEVMVYDVIKRKKIPPEKHITETYNGNYIAFAKTDSGIEAELLDANFNLKRNIVSDRLERHGSKMICRSHGKFGIIDEYFNFFVEPKYDWIDYQYDGNKFRMSLAGKWYATDTSCKLLFSCDSKWQNNKIFGQKLYSIVNDSLMVIMDTACHTEERHIPDSEYYKVFFPGHLSEKTQSVHPPVQIESSFHDGLATARDGRRLYGYIDTSCNWAIKPEYSSAVWPFDHHRAIVGTDDGYNLIRHDGTKVLKHGCHGIVTDATPNIIHKYIETLAVVITDTEDHLLLKDTFTYLSDFNGGRAFYNYLSKGAVVRGGIIDSQGNKTELKGRVDFCNNRYGVFTSDSQQIRRIYNISGKEVARFPLDYKYSAVAIYDNFVLMAGNSNPNYYQAFDFQNKPVGSEVIKGHVFNNNTLVYYSDSTITIKTETKIKTCSNYGYDVTDISADNKWLVINSLGYYRLYNIEKQRLLKKRYKWLKFSDEHTKLILFETADETGFIDFNGNAIKSFPKL